MSSTESFIALNRFGLGAGPGELRRLPENPRDWLKHQTRRPPPLPEAFDRLRSSAEIAEEIFAARQRGPQELEPSVRRSFRAEFGGGVLARTRQLVTSDAPFAERLVLFWSNHFTVSTTKRLIGPMIPAYEREAIRPHVFGRFADMLIAVTQHPVMLTYLDNFASMGSNSEAGRFRRRRSGAETTLNENLARELLELHTLGVNGGYTQEDVIELANAISGWTHGGVRLGRDTRPVHGEFEFNALFHEPGARTILGERYRAGGVEQGEAVLADLAVHPSTAEFIATKLVRHFVADEPAGEDIAYIAGVFLDSDGDLGAVSRALVDLDSAWSEPLPKVKSHYDFLVATYRATGLERIEPADLLEPLAEFGQLPFSAPSPAGWSDLSSYWLSPEALMRRVEWVRQLAATLPSTLYPSDLLEQTIGPVASDETRTWVSRAASTDEANALVLASAEFQRR